MGLERWHLIIEHCAFESPVAATISRSETCASVSKIDRLNSIRSAAICSRVRCQPSSWRAARQVQCGVEPLRAARVWDPVPRPAAGPEPPDRRPVSEEPPRPAGRNLRSRSFDSRKAWSRRHDTEQRSEATTTGPAEDPSRAVAHSLAPSLSIYLSRFGSWNRCPEATQPRSREPLLRSPHASFLVPSRSMSRGVKSQV